MHGVTGLRAYVSPECPWPMVEASLTLSKTLYLEIRIVPEHCVCLVKLDAIITEMD